MNTLFPIYLLPSFITEFSIAVLLFVCLYRAVLKPDGLLLRQRLQTLCRSVLLNNLETALDQKIETDL